MPLGFVLGSWLLFALPLHSSEKQAETQHLGVWTLQASPDSFTGARSCRLSGAHMEYRRGAVVFHFSGGTDTSAAVYRVDGGPPVETRSELMDMAHRGFAIYDDRLANPSAGVVRVPQGRLIDARSVSIRPSAKAAVTTFKLDGFGAALAAARSAGCGSEVSGEPFSP
jgi:hypothetical protein